MDVPWFLGEHAPAESPSQSGHWPGLRPGDTFGQETSPPLVGYECDGAPLDGIDERTGIAVLSRNAAGCDTPPGFEVLAAARLDGGWQEFPARDAYASAAGIHAAAIGVYSRNGTIFTAGTTDWAQVLARADDPQVERITVNVLNRLSKE